MVGFSTHYRSRAAILYNMQYHGIYSCPATQYYWVQSMPYHNIWRISEKSTRVEPQLRLNEIGCSVMYHTVLYPPDFYHLHHGMYDRLQWSKKLPQAFRLINKARSQIIWYDTGQKVAKLVGEGRSRPIPSWYGSSQNVQALSALEHGDGLEWFVLPFSATSRMMWCYTTQDVCNNWLSSALSLTQWLSTDALPFTPTQRV